MKRAWRWKLIPLTLLVLGILMSVFPAWAADVRTFQDDFTGASLDTDKWYLFSGSASVSGGTLNLTNGRLYSQQWFHFGVLEVNMSITNVADTPSFRLQGYAGEYYLDQIRFTFGSYGNHEIYTERSGSATTANDAGAADTNWHVWKIDWESDRIRLWKDGVLQTSMTITDDTKINQQYSRIVFVADGTTIFIGNVTYTEDFDGGGREEPSIQKCRQSTNLMKKFSTYTWNETEKKLTVLATGGGATDAHWGFHIPLSYRNYFVEVKVNGTKVTSDINFIRSTRVLNLSSPFTTINKQIDLQLIDPPVWLVDFSYWFMAATGISLAPLLKLWDRLAKRHKLLPYIVMLIGLVFLGFAVWYLWQWIGFQASRWRL